MRPVAHYLRVKVGVINIPFGVRRWAWRKCFGRMIRHAHVFGVNESLTVRQRRLYRKIAHEKGYAWFGTGSPNPIFWDTDKYHQVSGQVTQIHPAGTSRRARIFKGYNAARYMTEVVLESKEFPGTKIAFINTHWVPSGRRVPRIWRNQMREASIDQLARRVYAHNKAGRAVFPVGDLNIWRAIQVPGVRWLRGRGVDKVGIAVPSNVQITASRAYTFRAPTDHRKGVVGVVRLIVNPRSTT